jgi:hypothetical protein
MALSFFRPVGIETCGRNSERAWTVTRQALPITQPTATLIQLVVTRGFKPTRFRESDSRKRVTYFIRQRALMDSANASFACPSSTARQWRSA